LLEVGLRCAPIPFERDIPIEVGILIRLGIPSELLLRAIKFAFWITGSYQ
jgi:hypothetical protein